MSYDLAVWVGPRPSGDAEAVREFDRRSAFMDDEDAEFSPPTAPLKAFLADLMAAFPPLDESSDENNVWATGPEPGDVNGDFAYLTMTYPGARRAQAHIAQLVRKHGVICFDPQTETLV